MERDPIFGHQQRTMNRMMDSFFGGSGFGFGNGLMGPAGAQMMPFGGGFPGLGGMGGMGMMSPFGGGFPHMGEMMNDPNSHSFCSTSVMSVTSGPDGRPQVYHASSATRQAPGGVKETRKTLADTRTGTKKMSVGRHLGERAHIREREENMRTGQREENEDFLNMEEDEAATFNQEWRQRAFGGHHSSLPALGSYNPHPAYNHNHRAPPLQLTQRPHSRSEQPSAAAGGVTIEELPPSDEEEVDIRETLVAPTSRVARLLPSIPRIGRRNVPKDNTRPSPKTSKRTKKY